MNPDSRLTRNPKIVTRELAEPDGGVALHLETGAYHGLNQVGLIIWQHVDGERTVTDVVEAVRSEVPDAPPQLEEDVLAFLTSALERDLLRLVE